jgi:hypothetical protein
MLRLLVLTQTAVFGWFQAATSRPQLGPGRPLATRRLRAHAITMLEWVLIATVAVILFALLRDQLRSIFTDLIDRIRGAVSSN